MYAMGEFLKLRYYQLLLRGNPRMVYARSADTNVHLESAQILLAGLNPPKDGWLWSSFRDLDYWQPIAVHTNEPKMDDLLGPEVENCFRLERELEAWKNTSKYQQLLNEFRHDLQTLRSSTGLDFEDDLEMIIKIEDSLRTRKAYNSASLPDWYSQTMADRLTHIVDVCAESRYGPTDVQRLYVGRLLHEISSIIGMKIREHRLSMAAVQSGSSSVSGELSEIESQHQLGDKNPSRQADQSSLQQNCRETLSRHGEPNMFVFVMDRQRLSALLKSLRVYTIQPQFGSLLLVELHFDPINSAYFIRLFTTNSDDPVIITEPLRVNPFACGDSMECDPQQFEQNLRHLMLDKDTWRDACAPINIGPMPGTVDHVTSGIDQTTASKPIGAPTSQELDTEGSTTIADSYTTTTPSAPRDEPKPTTLSTGTSDTTFAATTWMEITTTTTINTHDNVTSVSAPTDSTNSSD